MTTACKMMSTHPRPLPSPALSARFHYFERSYGRASRSIRLPQHADVSKGSADYSDGVLRLTFPKRASLPPSSRFKIPITGSGGSGNGGGKLAIEDVSSGGH